MFNIYQSGSIKGEITSEYDHKYQLFTLNLSEDIHLFMDMDTMKKLHYEIEASLYQAYQEEGADK